MWREWDRCCMGIEVNNWSAHYAPARERYQELLALPHEINNILGDGAQRLLPLVTETMREVRERVGLA